MAQPAMTDLSQHERHMRRCIELARQAMEQGDSPVGSLIVNGARWSPKASRRCTLTKMPRLTRKWRRSEPRLRGGDPAI